MGPGSPGVRRVVVVLTTALLGVLGASVAPSAQAGPPLAAYRVSLAPATVDADTEATVTVTITNDLRRLSVLPLKAAVLTLPGLQVRSARVVTGPPRFRAVVADPTTVRLDAAGPPLLPGRSVAVEVVLAPGPAGSYPLATQGFGPASKEFGRNGPDPVLTVGPAPGSAAAALEFTGGPTSTVTGTPITPAVQVTARDAAGSPVAGVPVTLSYGANPGGAAPPGGNTATTGTDGVAAFPDLVVPAPGIGYTLVAATGALRSTPSEPFDVGDSVTPCDPGAACDSGTVAAPDGSTQVRIAADAAGSSDELTLFFDRTRLLCQTDQEFTATFNVDNRTKTVTYTVAGPAGTVGANHYDDDRPRTVCFGSPTTFPAAGGKQAVFNEHNQEFEGLLPACPYHATSTSVTQPCVAKRVDGPTGRVFTVLLPVGDPRMSH